MERSSHNFIFSFLIISVFVFSQLCSNFDEE